MNRYALAPAVICAVTMSGGCGAASPSDETMPRANKITAEAVVAEFERTTGEKPIPHRFDAAGFEPFETLRPSKELKQRYGRFHISVLQTAAEARATPSLRTSEPPDENGIRWQHIGESEFADPPTWVADKLYDNALLTWYTPVRAVDDRWRTLDGILRRVSANR